MNAGRTNTSNLKRFKLNTFSIYFHFVLYSENGMENIFNNMGYSGTIGQKL